MHGTGNNFSKLNSNLMQIVRKLIIDYTLHPKLDEIINDSVLVYGYKLHIFNDCILYFSGSIVQY